MHFWSFDADSEIMQDLCLRCCYQLNSPASLLKIMKLALN